MSENADFQDGGQEVSGTQKGGTAREAGPGTTPRHGTLLATLFWSFFKIGAFTFGGGWAMVPLIRRELVERRRWMGNDEFIDALAVAQSAPGPIAINTSVICGYKIAGLPGAVLATAGSSLPSFITILFVAMFVLHFKNSTLIPAVFKGMRPAIFGILAAAVWQVGKTTIKRRRDIAFFVAGVFLLLALNAHPILVVVLAAAGGLLYERFSGGKPYAGQPGAGGADGEKRAAGSGDFPPSKSEHTEETTKNGGDMA